MPKASKKSYNPKWTISPIYIWGPYSNTVISNQSWNHAAEGNTLRTPRHSLTAFAELRQLASSSSSILPGWGYDRGKQCLPSHRLSPNLVTYHHEVARMPHSGGICWKGVRCLHSTPWPKAALLSSTCNIRHISRSWQLFAMIRAGH